MCLCTYVRISSLNSPLYTMLLVKARFEVTLIIAGGNARQFQSALLSKLIRLWAYAKADVKVHSKQVGARNGVSHTSVGRGSGHDASLSLTQEAMGNDTCFQKMRAARLKIRRQQTRRWLKSASFCRETPSRMQGLCLAAKTLTTGAWTPRTEQQYVAIDRSKPI